MSPLLNNLAKIGLSVLFVVSIFAVSNYFNPPDGSYYETRNDYKGAIEEISQSLSEDRNKKKGYLYLNRSRNKRFLKDYDGAQKDLDIAKEIWQEHQKSPVDGQQPNFTHDLFLEQSKLYSHLGRFDEALQDCKAALLDRDSSRAHTQLAIIYEAKNQIDDAEKENNTAVNRTHHEVQSKYGIDLFLTALIARAEFYMRQGRLTNAFNDFDEAAKKDIFSDYAFCGRGLVQMQLKEYQKAIADFDKALSINADNKEAAHGKTKCLEMLKQTN
jgi:tetratricopeptide (TPR) repeat protein